MRSKGRRKKRLTCFSIWVMHRERRKDQTICLFLPQLQHARLRLHCRTWILIASLNFPQKPADSHEQRRRMAYLSPSLVGRTAAKAALERLAPAGTVACLLAANSPDSHVVVGLFADRWTLLPHHRGITHSLVGTICLALILPIL